MKLIIDIGNTQVKAALFEEKELKHFFTFGSTNELLVADVFERYPLTHCIVATVVNETALFINQLKEKTEVLSFTSKLPTPLKNLYHSPHTLGSDRLASAVGGSHLFPGKNVLVIDAGTCIKYNFVNSNNEFIGGAISPGIQMRLKALHAFTDLLPLVKMDENFEKIVGTNTNESILSGIETGVIAEAEGFVSRYQQLFSGLKVVLTGGDANFFEKRFKKSIFADKFLVLKGLNLILDHNLHADKN